MLRKRLTDEVPEADVKVYRPPPVRGVGRAGGFNMIIEDPGGHDGIEQLQKQTDKLVARATRPSLNDGASYVPSGDVGSMVDRARDR